MGTFLLARLGIVEDCHQVVEELVFLFAVQHVDGQQLFGTAGQYYLGAVDNQSYLGFLQIGLEVYLRDVDGEQFDGPYRMFQLQESA